MIRVLLADDQALMRARFRALLDAEDDLEVVGEAADDREQDIVALVARGLGNDEIADHIAHGQSGC